MMVMIDSALTTDSLCYNEIRNSIYANYGPSSTYNIFIALGLTQLKDLRSADTYTLRMASPSYGLQ